MIFRLLLLSCALLALPAAAEEQQYAFRILDTDQGLTHNTVLAILQDRTGFMWFGTKDGLNRYDGSELRPPRPLRRNRIDGFLILVDGFVTMLPVKNRYL